MAGKKPSEISDILKQQIAGITSESQLDEVGFVLQVGMELPVYMDFAMLKQTK
jgi:hypothetical protein